MNVSENHPQVEIALKFSHLQLNGKRDKKHADKLMNNNYQLMGSFFLPGQDVILQLTA